MNIAPNRKTITIGVPLLAVAGFVVWFGISSYTKSTSNTPPAITVGSDDISSSLAVQVTEKDSDSDGLRDWEESLWKTDSTNPDSDGDGTTDGDEVKVGRDPAVAGPNDEVSGTKSSTSSSAQQSASASLSNTDQFARTFFTNYMTLKESSGGTLSQTQRDELLQRSLNEATRPSIQPAAYSSRDVNLISQTDSEAVKKYANDVAIAIIKNIPSETSNEAVILKEALDSDNPAPLERLDPVITSYETMLKELLAIPTPTTMATAHVRMVNSIAATVVMVRGMRSMFQDPLQGLQQLGKYQQNSADFMNAIIGINTTAEATGVSFAANDAWYALTHFSS